MVEGVRPGRPICQADSTDIDVDGLGGKSATGADNGGHGNSGLVASDWGAPLSVDEALCAASEYVQPGGISLAGFLSPKKRGSATLGCRQR